MGSTSEDMTTGAVDGAASASENEKGPLGPQDIEQYRAHGYVMLKAAFSPSVAEACRNEIWRLMEQEEGIRRDDPSTWPVKCPIAKIFGPDQDEPWTGVFTSRLKRAVDQLCGDGRWEEFGCGWWMITFPGHHDPDSWWLDGHWHIDGVSKRRCVHNREVGLVPIFLFSDVKPKGGGTALSTGSHKWVARELLEAGTTGASAHDLCMSGAEYVEQQPDSVVETVGEAGDVMLTHPYLIHGRSTNCGAKGDVSAVRFMCHPGVRLREDTAYESLLSPTEEAVVDVWRGQMGRADGRVFGREGCCGCTVQLEPGGGEGVEDDQGVDQEAMREMLGFASFTGRKRPRKRLRVFDGDVDDARDAVYTERETES